ncbi:hypothetical protein GCM10009811_25930 [Nostocoides veronense]|uniref:Uncharacterized protein n=2 Tax=Nostocoides veronense TaxID=330836 RepID=A0ABN2LYZ6_9MICO
MTFADQPATMPTQLADGAPLASRAALEAAMQGKHEAFRLDGLVATLGAEVARAGAAVEARARQLASESADVERLEGVSLSRLFGSIRGSRLGDLERERAERDAASIAYDAAVRDRDRLTEQLSDVRRRRIALGDVSQTYDAAVAAYSMEASELGRDGGRDLFAITQRLAAARSRLRELDEALAAGDGAARDLDAALKVLGSADGWSTYDTFLGGGMLSSAIKRDKIDDASALLSRAAASIERFRRESADVGDVPVPDLSLSNGLRTLDVWFDNIFTDLSVRGKIKEALDGARRSAALVSRSMSLLSDTRGQSLVEIERLVEARDRLLQQV